MKKFWESKKWLALAICVVLAVAAGVLKTQYNIDIDVNAVMAVTGLTAVYVLRQGSIDAKKTNQNALKPFWQSNKFVALLVGQLLPIGIGLLNEKAGLNISGEMILGLIGLNGVYILRQGAIDAKEPDKH